MPEAAPTALGIGIHSNPRRYECENSFRSQVATSPDAAAHDLWTTTTTPARTTGKNTEIYTIVVYNHSGGAGTVTILVGGNPIFPPIPCPAGEMTPISLETPIKVGDNDVQYQASGADIDTEIIGLEV